MGANGVCETMSKECGKRLICSSSGVSFENIVEMEVYAVSQRG
jgi:hypothetical protein